MPDKKSTRWLWVKLSHKFYTDPKVLAAGEKAAWLYVAGLCYAGEHQTDGVIPRAAISRLVDDEAPARARRLVEAGLWEVLDENTFLIHNFSRDQMTTEKVEEKRAQERERQERFRDRKGLTKTDPAEPDAPITIEQIRANVRAVCERCFVEGDNALTQSKFSQLYNTRINEAVEKYAGTKGLGTGDNLRQVVVCTAAEKYLGRELTTGEMRRLSGLRARFGIRVIQLLPVAVSKATGDPFSYIEGIIKKEGDQS